MLTGIEYGISFTLINSKYRSKCCDLRSGDVRSLSLLLDSRLNMMTTGNVKKTGSITIASENLF